MGERVKALRKALNLTQQEFAERIGLSRNYVAMIEIGQREPSDRTISDICREFSVNEAWLRSGEGEMLAEVPEEQLIADFIYKVANGENEFLRRLVRALAKLDLEDWKKLEQVAQKLKDEE